MSHDEQNGQEQKGDDNPPLYAAPMHDLPVASNQKEKTDFKSIHFNNKPSFNDGARFKITIWLLFILGSLVGLSLLGWFVLAIIEINLNLKSPIYSNGFGDFAKFLITGIVSIVSAAAGFYFGTKSMEGRNG